ncbi:hypothetical protein ACSQ67_011511 [Phaseolus vulgaris]
MGNAVVTPCFHQKNSASSLLSSKLIFWDGSTRCLKGKHIAGEIMFEFPDKVVCHADSFFIGHPIPALALEDELMVGEDYFVLPIQFFTCKTLSVSSLLSLGSSPNKATLKFGECAFEYLKGSNGRVLIKVMPQFITMLINRGKRSCPTTTSHNNFLCSTPELKKHYQMLVKTKDQVWSPKLETISEYKHLNPRENRRRSCENRGRKRNARVRSWKTRPRGEESRRNPNYNNEGLIRFFRKVVAFSQPLFHHLRESLAMVTSSTTSEIYATTTS